MAASRKVEKAGSKRGNHSEHKMNAAIERIGKEMLGLETLATRNSSSLDFSDQAVWTLRSALEAAYQAGLVARKSGWTELERAAEAQKKSR